MKTIQPVPPYSFDLLLDILQRFTHPVVDITHDQAMWRALRFDDAIVLVKITGSGSPDRPVIHYETVAQTGSINESHIDDAILHILGVDTDRSDFYTYARTQPELWEVVKPLLGMPRHCAASLFEALVLTTIEQQIAWTAAQKAQRWLVEWSNNSITYNGRTYYAFPTPEQLAVATIDDLTPLKITFKRMGVIINIAQQIASGQLDLESLRSQPPDDVYKALVSLKGIGHWTATWSLTRIFGAQNYVGHNDVALQAAANHFFNGATGRMSEADLQALFARYGDYAGMAAHYTLMRWVVDRYEANSNHSY